jgi:hypothetical protein
MIALVDAVAAGRPSPVPFDEAVVAMAATFAIEESLDTGRPVPIGSRWT